MPKSKGSLNCLEPLLQLFTLASLVFSQWPGVVYDTSYHSFSLRVTKIRNFSMSRDCRWRSPTINAVLY